MNAEHEISLFKGCARSLAGHSGRIDGADARTLAHLDLGNNDAAMHYLRTQVAGGRTGRLPGEANDSVLLLAALAHAEGEILRARELLLQSWFCRTDATIIWSEAKISCTGGAQSGDRRIGW